MFEVTKEQQKQIDKIAMDYNLKLVLLHGSYATGTQYGGSDLDIAVLGHKRIDGRTHLKLFSKFVGVFGNTPEHELDLKTLHGVDPLFLYYVARDSQLLYGTSLDYNEFRAYAFQRYMDSKDLRELETILIHRAQKHLNQKYAG
jgi:uncharacterized protein